MGVIYGTIPYIPGTIGESFIGGPNLDLGPANLYYGKTAGTNLTGTATASSSATITGSGTAFNTELTVGQYIKFTSLTGVYRVVKITSATSIDIDTAVTVTADTMKRISLLALGGVDAVSIKLSVGLTELFESQYGANAADRVKTSFDASVEFGMTRPTLERMERTMNGLKLQRNATTGLPEAGAMFFNIGERDSTVWDELHIIRIRGTGESSNALDHITFFRAVPKPDVETKNDAASQIIFKQMFNVYQDDTRLNANGQPAIFAFGDYTF